ncbi:MAG: YbjP/YqhG family protein [Acidobacteriota bacterium]|nr:YbjP/YqhG family protein [Acidobacteriota bacterium]
MSFRFQVSSFRFQVSGFNFKFLNAKSFLLFTFYFLLFTSACSIPNLEKPECTEARQTVREFYSFHFGNDMKFSKDNLQKRERFLTDKLKQNLAAQAESSKDYFTATDDYPKAFRVGDCSVAGENKVVFQVVLFWKDDTRSEQREIRVETVKQNDKWLIDKAEN